MLKICYGVPQKESWGQTSQIHCQPKDWIVVTYNLKTGTILMCYFYMYSHINRTEVS